MNRFVYGSFTGRTLITVDRPTSFIMQYLGKILIILLRGNFSDLDYDKKS